jgi:hypothetical protein
MTSSLRFFKGCPGWYVIITYVCTQGEACKSWDSCFNNNFELFFQIFDKKLALKHFFIIKKLPPYNLVGFDLTTLNSADGDGSTM